MREMRRPAANVIEEAADGGGERYLHRQGVRRMNALAVVQSTSLLRTQMDALGVDHVLATRSILK